MPMRSVFVPLLLVGLAVAAEPAVPSKMTFDARVAPLPHSYQGPFVNMPDGSIVGIEQNTVIRSADGGKTWSANEIFSADQAAKLHLQVSNERALLLTKDGTLVRGCMALNGRKWT